MAARATTTSPLRSDAPDAPEPSGIHAHDTHAIELMVEGLRRSDPAISRQFYELYSPRISRALTRLLGRTDELEDLVHEVFVDALGGIHQLREPAALSGWMTGIAVLTAKRRLQRHYRRRWLSLSLTGAMPEPSSSPTDGEARAAFSAIRDLLDEMRPEDRIAVLLYRLDGLTVNEAAEAMSVSPSTFKRRLKRGERHLLKLARRCTLLNIWLENEARLM